MFSFLFPLKSVTTNDMKYLEGKRKRVSAIGCQYGLLVVFLVDVIKNGKINNIESDSFSSFIHIFKKIRNFEKI